MICNKCKLLSDQNTVYIKIKKDLSHISHTQWPGINITMSALEGKTILARADHIHSEDCFVDLRNGGHVWSNDMVDEAYSCMAKRECFGYMVSLLGNDHNKIPIYNKVSKCKDFIKKGESHDI